MEAPFSQAIAEHDISMVRALLVLGRKLLPFILDPASSFCVTKRIGYSFACLAARYPTFHEQRRTPSCMTAVEYVV